MLFMLAVQLLVSDLRLSTDYGIDFHHELDLLIILSVKLRKSRMPCLSLLQSAVQIILCSYLLPSSDLLE